MTTLATGVSPAWLALRESADAAARATDLADEVARALADRIRATSTEPIVVHDLGCGSGAMGRWLAPRLPGPQHWILYDRDADLLAHAAAAAPATKASGPVAITVETRQRDITRLDDAELVNASLVTASALLDMLTVEELGRIVATCARAGCPALLALSVIGRVELEPADPLDDAITLAFNAHQRRLTERGRLLGPDAVRAALDAFRSAGAEVVTRPSTWRLGGNDTELLTEWFTGWVGAACEQQPQLVAAAGTYVRRRLDDVVAGRLRARVHHCDLLVRWR